MKLYLSSYRIPTPQKFYDLVGKKPKNIKIALIPNAKDYYAKRARDFKVNEMVTYLKNMSLQVEIVDLRDYKDIIKLKKKLLEKDVMWVMGGNTFCLRYEMRQSGFEKIVRNVLGSGVVYGGDSAGAAVAGTNLKGIELADDMEFAKEAIYEGLHLIPHFILPHVGSVGFGAVIDQVREAQTDKTPIIELTDDQAYIFIEGAGEVVDKEKVV